MNLLKDLYIVGAGGFGKEIAWMVERINEVSPTWNLKGFIDDNLSSHERIWKNNCVVGNDDYLLQFQQEVWVVCAIASTKIRKKIVEKLKQSPYIRFATLIDPSVICSERVSIGEGSIICARSIITVDIVIGTHVIINLDCTVAHDDCIRDFVTIYPSVNVSGNVHVGECAELGTGTQIIQGISIGEGSIIGAGSVVIRDIPDKCTAVGIPAKPIKFFE